MIPSGQHGRVGHESPRSGRATAGCVAIAATFVFLCASPHWARARHPSLFSDDVIRLACLRTTPLGSILFRPFNEHVAPLFEAVSWLTWRASGDRLVDAPFAFTVASLVPFALCAAGLGVLVGSETRSGTTGLAAVAAFSLSSVHVEAAWWFSASSFTWALLATLVAWFAAARAAEPGGRRGWWPISAVAACSAPAFSAIGMLAGPVAAIRALSPVGDRGGRRRRLAAAAVPIAGTASYLLASESLGYRDVLAGSVREHAAIAEGLLNVLRAPARVLLPGLVGLDDPAHSTGTVEIVVVGLAGLMALALGWRSPHRPSIYGGLALIVAGYGATYPVRSGGDPRWALSVGRYHLFPQAGLVIALAPAVLPILRRLDAKGRAAGLVAATAIAASMLGIHSAAMARAADRLDFPDQAKTLAALDHLGEICRAAGISRDRALALLPPIRPRWFPHDSPGVPSLIGSTGMDGRANRSPSGTSPLAALSVEDREGLFGTMDISGALRPAADRAGTSTSAAGRLTRVTRLRPTGSPGTYRCETWISSAEFEFATQCPSGDPGASGLIVPAGRCEGWTELWWAGPDQPWSESRSVRWKATAPAPGREWLIPPGTMPHWSPGRSRRMKLVYRRFVEVSLSDLRIIEAPGPPHPDADRE